MLLINWEITEMFIIAEIDLLGEVGLLNPVVKLLLIAVLEEVVLISVVNTVLRCTVLLENRGVV